MKSLPIFITSYVCLCVCLSHVYGLQCTGSHEELKCVQHCPPEKTCENKDALFNCFATDKKCELKCLCEDGYYRDITNECVTNETCESKCPGPNEYYSCGGACDNVCETLHIMNQTHCPIVNFKCNEMCYCKDGYARDANNICVPFQKCQPSSVKQDRNRRDTSLSKKESKCPGPNEYYSCGGACDNVCETLHVMNQTHCPIVNIKCNEMCYCKDGYARDANNICVPFQKCQRSSVKKHRNRRDTSLTETESSCGDDEEYKTCTCPPDTCLSLVAKFKCGECVPGCACRSGYLRQTADEPCRPMRECKELANSPDFN